MSECTPSEPVDVLLDFEDWATGCMFDACDPLTDEQIDREFEIGIGTLRKTLMHNISAMVGWTGVMNGSTPDFSPDFGGENPSIDRLRRVHADAMKGFRTALKSGPWSTILEPERKGTSYRFTRGGIMTHVVTHSMHHRAQCLNMIRRLGVDTQPQSSVFQWMLAHPPGES